MNARELLSAQGYVIVEKAAVKGPTHWIDFKGSSLPCPACLVNLRESKFHVEQPRGKCQVWPEAARANAKAIRCYGESDEPVLMGSLCELYGVQLGRRPNKSYTVEMWLHERGIPVVGQEYRSLVKIAPWERAISNDQKEIIGYETSGKLLAVTHFLRNGYAYQKTIGKINGRKLQGWYPAGENARNPQLWGGRTGALPNPDPDWIYLSEGHEDCLSLMLGAGLTAYTCGGTGTIMQEHVQLLRERHPDVRGVKIAFDADAAGSKGKAKVVRLLRYHPDWRVLFLVWPEDAEPGSDVNELLRKMGDQFPRVLRDMEWRDTTSEAERLGSDPSGVGPGDPGPDADGVRSGDRRPGWTDMGNAQRFAELHKGSVFYAHDSGRWIVWCGSHWVIDDSDEVMKLARQVVVSMHVEADRILDRSPDNAGGVRLERHASSSEGVGRLRAMVELARSEPALACHSDQFDTNPWLLNVANGTVDLRNGALNVHRREDMITHLLAVPYEKEAVAPVWDDFIEGVTLGQLSFAEFLQRSMGYCITGDTRHRCYFYFVGRGSNGKGIFLNTIQALLGTDRYSGLSGVLPRESLLESPFPGIPHEIARCARARMVTLQEIPKTGWADEGKIKSLTGRDRVAARFLRAEFFDFIPSFKICVSANHRWKIKGNDDAIWERHVEIRFQAQFMDPTKIEEGSRYQRPIDRDLREKLMQELPGILTWLVQGAVNYFQPCESQPDGCSLRIPEWVLAWTSEYREQSDSLAPFLGEVCEKVDTAEYRNGTANVNKPALRAFYKSYKAWCLDNDEDPIKERAFIKSLKEDYGYEAVRGEDSSNHWVNMRLTGGGRRM